MKFLISIALMFAACTHGGTPISGDLQKDGVITKTLRVEPSDTRLGQSVRITLNLQNGSGHAHELVFPTAQRFDFWVTSNSREIWRWSDEMAFAQELTQQTIDAQGRERHTVTWNPSAAGDLVVHAESAAEGLGGELTARISVAKR